MYYVRICTILLDGKYDAAVSRKYSICDDAKRMHSPRNPFPTDVEIYMYGSVRKLEVRKDAHGFCVRLH